MPNEGTSILVGCKVPTGADQDQAVWVSELYKPRGHVTIGDIEKGDLLMKNIEMSVEGETLIIKVDLSKDFGPSKSGKTIIVASTEGNVSVLERDEKIGLNIYRYPA